MKSKELFEALNIKSPYNHIRSLSLEETPTPDWGGKSKIFSDFITNYKPHSILELGSFLGDSTITMAKLLKENSIDGCILTIDTWLGSQEHWLKDKCNLLHLYDNFEYGISTLYNKCVTNIIKSEVEDFIVPFPTTTSTAYDVLFAVGMKFDMIYMDADHNENVVYSDLNKYCNLLNDGGVMFGHDIDWIGIKNAVELYCKDNGLTYDVIQDNDGIDKFWKINI
jgi:predicted O-methyltransferase YrrM